VLHDVIDALLYDPVKVDFRLLWEETIDIVDIGCKGDGRRRRCRPRQRFQSLG
jgi:hypothetical protein